MGKGVLTCRPHHYPLSDCDTPNTVSSPSIKRSILIFILLLTQNFSPLFCRQGSFERDYHSSEEQIGKYYFYY